MNKNGSRGRYQSVISRQSDQEESHDHWLKQFENSLQKTSVQPISNQQDLYDQITSIMNNGKSKFTSVQQKVDEMMSRSGLTTYLDNVKLSSQKEEKTVTTFNSQKKKAQKQNNNLPQIIQDSPVIFQTLENIIHDTRGNMPVPAIINRLRSLHNQDVPDDGAWEDEKLIRLVSKLNLQAKKDNPSNYNQFSNLGLNDSGSNTEIDAANTDAWHALMPTKL